MNILMIYKNNPLVGAGGPVYDIFQGLRRRGHDVRVLVNSYAKEYPDGIINMETWFQLKRKEFNYKLLTKLGLIKKRPANPDYHFHNLNEKKEYYRSKKFLKKAGFIPDVIILLFGKEFISYRNVYELHKITGAPVFMTFYDMAPMTGGCHYAWDCVGYESNCGNCPGLYSSDPQDITYKNMVYKKKYLDKTDIRIVIGNEWQYRQAKRSSLFKGFPIHKLITSMNHEIFKPVSKVEAREKVGISLTKKVIFFGAVYLDHKRKGFDYLLEALGKLKAMLFDKPQIADNILLLIAGQEFESIKDKMPFEYHYMGMVDNGYGIASAYQAADIYVCPSVQDAGPTMINQSIMAGTPVVSFENGVALDLVKTGETGYLARLFDSSDLATGMLKILSLSDEEYQQMKVNCRNLGMELFQPDVNMQHWADLIMNSTSKPLHT